MREKQIYDENRSSYVHVSLREKFLACSQNSQGTSWFKRTMGSEEEATRAASFASASLQRIKEATTDRSGRTQCQAKKTGNTKQTTAWARQEHEDEKRRRTVRSSATCGGKKALVPWE